MLPGSLRQTRAPRSQPPRGEPVLARVVDAPALLLAAPSVACGGQGARVARRDPAACHSTATRQLSGERVLLAGRRAYRPGPPEPRGQDRFRARVPQPRVVVRWRA